MSSPVSCTPGGGSRVCRPASSPARRSALGPRETATEPLYGDRHALGAAARERHEAELLGGAVDVEDDAEAANAAVAVFVEVSPVDVEALARRREPWRI